MAPDAEITNYLRHTVVLVESTIPGDMTVAEWRAQRRRQPAPAADPAVDQVGATVHRLPLRRRSRIAPLAA
jgi:hypothetical protein